MSVIDTHSKRRNTQSSVAIAQSSSCPFLSKFPYFVRDETLMMSACLPTLLISGSHLPDFCVTLLGRHDIAGH
jgi:hypothetical protein